MTTTKSRSRRCRVTEASKVKVADRGKIPLKRVRRRCVSGVLPGSPVQVAEEKEIAALRHEPILLPDSRNEEVRSCVSLATGIARRARGLLLHEPNQQALLIAPCSDVHTVGMRYAIDVAFVDDKGCVIESHRAVGPLRRLRNKAAVAVVERFASCTTPWFSAGDHVVITSERGPGHEGMSSMPSARI